MTPFGDARRYPNLARAGAQRSVTKLARHNCIPVSSKATIVTWQLTTDDIVVCFQCTSNFSYDSAVCCATSLSKGKGIVRLADFVVGKAMRDGELV